MTRIDKGPVDHVLAFFGSLKLTVVLLTLSLFLVFVGTLAQVDQGIWVVMSQYFRCWIAWIDFRILGAFFPTAKTLPGSVPFPGGALIGLLLGINLLVSHAQRVRVKAEGKSLYWGVGALVVGLVATWFAISHVFDADSSRETVDPTWRVMRQLLQGGGAAVVLLVACFLLFRKKAGITLLHIGVLLIMISEYLTWGSAHEGQMTIHEGSRSNFVRDIRAVELAVIDRSDPDEDRVVVVPESLVRSGKRIRHSLLPFDLEPAGPGYLPNSFLHGAGGHDHNPATAGSGLVAHAEERKVEVGVDSSGGVDMPSAYFRLTRDGKELGVYLVSVELASSRIYEKVEVDGKTYDLCLRYARTYKPYTVELEDFLFKRYEGTDIPKDYSSFARILDEERGVDRKVRIWMNNPLRYRGDTLYQSSFHPSERATVLQVVDNEGWMVPYVGCMIVAFGLLAQFMLHLIPFLRRRMAE